MDQQRIIAVLKGAREFITDPKRWTQGVSWRDESDRAVYERSEAYCACALGAIRLSLTHHFDNFHIVAEHLRHTLDVRGHERRDCMIARFNDTHTHTEVLALFDETITRLETK